MAAKGGAGNYGVGGDWELLFGSEPDAQAKAAALAQALRGQQNDALALQALTGGPRAAPAIGQTMAANAQQEMAGLGQAAATRSAQEIQRAHYAQQGEQLRASLAQHAAAQAETKRHNLAVEATHASDVAGQAPTLTSDAMDQMAEMFASTGNMPALGQGKKGTELRQKIINRAAEMFPGNDLAGGAATYKADKQSLQSLQTKMDALTAFERMAGKNLDVLEEAQKGVTDTGIPVLNKVVRGVQRATGSPEMAKYDIARQTGAVEAARILNNPNLTGELSDSARKELNDIIRGDATTEQMSATLGVIRRDFKNRHSGYTQQLSEVKGRIGKRGQAAQSGEGAAGSARVQWNPQTGDFE